MREEFGYKCVQRLSQLECCGLCNWQVLLCANGCSVHIKYVYRCYCEWYDGGLGYCLRCRHTSEGMKHTNAWWGILVFPEFSPRRESLLCAVDVRHIAGWWSHDQYLSRSSPTRSQCHPARHIVLKPVWKFWYWDPQHFDHSLAVLNMCYKALPDEDCLRVG